MNSAPSTQPPGQWDDFLAREVDLYAQAKYEILLGWLGDLTGKSVLVIGSGSGEFAAELARAGGLVRAVDIDAASVSLTLATARRLGVQLETQVAKLEDLDAGLKYDVVVATDVIEHIENDRDAAARLGALLKPQGILLVTVPALPAIFGYHDESLGHFRRYDKARLRTLFEPLVRITRLRYFGLSLVPFAWIVSRKLRRPYPVAPFAAANHRHSWLGFATRIILNWEKTIMPPFGTSLFLLASPR